MMGVLSKDIRGTGSTSVPVPRVFPIAILGRVHHPVTGQTNGKDMEQWNNPAANQAHSSY
jgi:hypothetical protein